MQKILERIANRSSEYPAVIYWLLTLVLWALSMAAFVAVFVNSDHLELWKITLYIGLLGVYLIGEKRAYRPPTGLGRRAHEPLRYLLALSWWALFLTPLLFYALWPVEQVAITILGVICLVCGSGLRIWSVYTLGSYYSGHIETWEHQAVITGGPYRWLRHPGYAGNMLQAFALPLILNAYPVLILSFGVILLFVRRLLWEETWLEENLPGYREYMCMTWRLLPGVW